MRYPGRVPLLMPLRKGLPPGADDHACVQAEGVLAVVVPGPGRSRDQSECNLAYSHRVRRTEHQPHLALALVVILLALDESTHGETKMSLDLTMEGQDESIGLLFCASPEATLDFQLEFLRKSHDADDGRHRACRAVRVQARDTGADIQARRRVMLFLQLVLAR